MTINKNKISRLVTIVCLYFKRQRHPALFKQAQTRSLCLRKLLKKPALASGRPITAATLLIGRNRVSIGDK